MSLIIDFSFSFSSYKKVANDLEEGIFILTADAKVIRQNKNFNILFINKEKNYHEFFLK